VSLQKMEPLSPSGDEVEWWQPCVWTHRCGDVDCLEARQGREEPILRVARD
jgi:hypothetical protein